MLIEVLKSKIHRVTVTDADLNYIGSITLDCQLAPASADLMAKMANGLANDLASTLLLSTDTPVLIAPAMNVRMWDHPATQRNLAQLVADGVHIVGPNPGDMACGEYGPGRMSEPLEIIDAIAAHVALRPLDGHKDLVTSGPNLGQWHRNHGSRSSFPNTLP